LGDTVRRPAHWPLTLIGGRRVYTFEHVEIPTTDIRKAAKFYSALLQWKLEKFYGDDYLMIHTPDDTIIGGLTQVKEVHYQEEFTIYVGVPDVTEMLQRAVALGAKIVREKTELPDNHGFYGKIKTPDGYCLGLWSRQ
jgi:uncharacterized protein